MPNSKHFQKWSEADWNEEGCFAGAEFWNAAGEVLSDPAFTCTSADTEKWCFMGGADPVQIACTKLENLAPDYNSALADYNSALADYNAYLEEHRRPDGLTTGYMKGRMPDAVNDRRTAAEDAYEGANQDVSDAVQRVALAVLLEGLALAGFTDRAQVFEIARRVIKGE